jgi:DNA-binding CsgD family transcriptional regulator
MISKDLINRIEQCVFQREDTAVLKAVAEHYDLSHIAFLGLHVPQNAFTDQPFSFLTYPKEWVDRYLSNGYVKFDPAVHSALKSVIPVDWNTLNKSAPNVRKLFGEAREFGIGEMGMTFPLRGCHGETALLTITGDFSEKEWRDFKHENMADLQILSLYIFRMIEKSTGKEALIPKLSNREIECLKWASSGKTFEDISVILSLSSRTVKFYLDTARNKLNCLSVAHAVARGISLGIIPPMF